MTLSNPLAQEILGLSADLMQSLDNLRSGTGDPLGEIERVASLLTHVAESVEVGSDTLL